MNIVKNLILLFLLCLFIPKVYSQQLTQDELYNAPKVKMNQANKRKNSIYFSDEVLKDFDSEIGVESDVFFTQQDKNRFSLAYHFSSDVSSFSDISSFELMYLSNMQDWKYTWWGVLLKMGSGSFNAISQNADADASAPATAEANNQRPDGASQSYTIMGIGMGHRFRFLLDFAKTIRWYEQITAFATYTTNTDEFTNREYSGPGFVVDYELYKRKSRRVFYGFKISYNFASVSRDVEVGERNRHARLTLSWLSLGFNLGYYY